MEISRTYTSPEMERMIKLQDVLLKATAKKITWWQSAEVIGVSARTMRRWRERFERDGYEGMADRRKGRSRSWRNRSTLPSMVWRLTLLRDALAVSGVRPYFGVLARRNPTQQRTHHALRCGLIALRRFIRGHSHFAIFFVAKPRNALL